TGGACPGYTVTIVGLGATCSTPVATNTPAATNTPGGTPTCAASTNLITDGSFEGGTPSTAWTESSTNFGTPLCDVTGCGNGGGTVGPRTGNWWSWFGGIDSLEDASVEQTVNIPAGTATLNFYLWIGAHSGLGSSDYIRALVGGTEVFRADDSSTAYDAGYVLVSVNVSAQSGGSRVVRLESHNVGGGSNVFNASVDDVSLLAGGGCTTATTTPVATSTGVVPTNTAVATSTSAATVTTAPTGTSVPTSIPTATVCPIQFTDVDTSNTFYANIRCLACRGIVSGYNTNCPTGNPCFRPDNNVTRGQLSKMVSNSAGFTDIASGQQYQDVPPGSTFYDYVYRLNVRGYINGYPCGGPGEPCGVGNLPYFRPNASVTRGQLSKIVANGAGLTGPAGAQQYEDVLPGSTFYDYIWRLTNLGVMTGYPCGGPGEPCGNGNLPYFRPGANASRGQASKIVSNTFFPNCVTPFRPSINPNARKR
ncbi:MAG: S-layer homology domain-containing protein, partial [Chloroflexia bacterium]